MKPDNPSDSHGSNSLNAGPLYALLAYGAWELLPVYWKFFGSVPAVEVLSHRMIWSAVFLYLAPSLSLLLGVFLYGEPFTPTHAVTFSCIWLALLLYSFTALRKKPQGRG